MSESLPSNFVVLDVETTGLNPFEDRIIEIGAVRYRDNRQVGEFSQLIACPYLLPERIVELTGITDGMLAGEPQLEKVIVDFVQWLGGDTIVGHNVKFDASFLQSWYSQATGEEFDGNMICTMQMARFALPNLKRHNLDTVAAHFELGRDGYHRALGDAKLAAEVFQRLKCLLEKRLDVPTGDGRTKVTKKDELSQEYRAREGDVCIVCGGTIGGGAHWVQRDRHVCSSGCNDKLKRMTRCSKQNEARATQQTPQAPPKAAGGCALQMFVLLALILIAAAVTIF